MRLKFKNLVLESLMFDEDEGSSGYRYLYYIMYTYIRSSSGYRYGLLFKLKVRV